MSLIGPEGRRQLQLAARFLSAGIVLGVTIVVGYGGGWLLDRWLGTEPYCALTGLALGVVAGFRDLFLLARTASRLSSAAPKNDDEGPRKDDTSPPP